MAGKQSAKDKRTGASGDQGVEQSAALETSPVEDFGSNQEQGTAVSTNCATGSATSSGMKSAFLHSRTELARFKLDDSDIRTILEDRVFNETSWEACAPWLGSYDHWRVTGAAIRAAAPDPAWGAVGEVGILVARMRPLARFMSDRDAGDVLQNLLHHFGEPLQGDQAVEQRLFGQYDKEGSSRGYEFLDQITQVYKSWPIPDTRLPRKNAGYPEDATPDLAGAVRNFVGMRSADPQDSALEALGALRPLTVAWPT